MADDNKNEQKAQDRYERANAEAGQKLQQDFVDETANTNIYLADIGTSLTSHGEGDATISPQYVARREEVREFNADPDRDNRAVARRLGRDV
ncbi:MAG: hypothetical protein M3R38_22170 [Actinomycetota bacterium]|nr:hypothetical protein [Actinomycetota bacterium]